MELEVTVAQGTKLAGKLDFNIVSFEGTPERLARKFVNFNLSTAAVEVAEDRLRLGETVMTTVVAFAERSVETNSPGGGDRRSGECC